MRFRSILTVSLALCVAGPAWAGILPDKIGFTIYAEGKPVGKSAITVVEKDGRLIFTGEGKIERDGQVLHLIKSRTVADAKTFQVLEFELTGETGGQPVDVNALYTADAITGYALSGGTKYNYARTPTFEHTIFLGDFIFEHQVLLALAHMREGKDLVQYDFGLLFPRSFTLTTAKITTASEAIIESDDYEAVVKKLFIAISGSEPFIVFYDPKRKLPVYLAFPASNTEVFLDQFFGDNPISRFR